MIVKMCVGTNADPGPKVVVESNIKLTTVESFDRWLKVQKLARDWLKKELEK